MQADIDDETHDEVAWIVKTLGRSPSGTSPFLYTSIDSSSVLTLLQCIQRVRLFETSGIEHVEAIIGHR